MTDVDGARESLPAGHDPRCLVPAREPEPLAESIGALLSEPELRESLGRQGRRHVLTTHDVRLTADAVAGVYRELLAGVPAQHAGSAACGDHTECRESIHS